MIRKRWRLFAWSLLGAALLVHGEPRAGPPPMEPIASGLMPIEIAFAPDLLPRFAKHRPVIAIEPQGHGHTADRPAAPSMEQMAEDVRAVLDHLKVGRPTCWATAWAA